MDNGWKVDNEGRRCREIAPGHIEFEPTIVVDGIENVFGVAKGS